MILRLSHFPASACSRDVVSLTTRQRIWDVIAWLRGGESDARHQGFPVLDDSGRLAGLLTRRDLLDQNVSGDALVSSLIRHAQEVVREAHSLRKRQIIGCSQIQIGWLA